MSCKTLLARKWEQAVAPGSARRFEVSFDEALRRQWESKEWELGDTIQVGGFDAECVVPGRSGPVPPRFPQVLDKEVPDGSARWKMVAPSDASLISAVDEFDWDLTGGISVDQQADEATTTTAVLTLSDDLEPGDYTIMVTATAGVEIIKQPCILQVA